MSLKIGAMPDTEVATQSSNVPEGMEQPPPSHPSVTTGKRHRRTRLEIALEKQAAGKELNDKDRKALEKANVKKPVQTEEVNTDQTGEDSVSDVSDDTPPWEDPAQYEAALTAGSEPTQQDAVGHFGPSSLPQEEKDVQKLGEVGNFYNIGGVRCQLVHRDYDFLIFKKAPLK